MLKQNFDWVRDNYSSISVEGNRVLNETWSDRSQITKVVDVKVNKLDTVLEKLAEVGINDAFHFLKSDTQSGEFQVLEGAQGYLGSDCVGLELELYRYPLYGGAVHEDVVKALLDNLGFRVAGWTGYQNSFAAQADYLFLRRKPRSPSETSLIEKIEQIYSPKGTEGYIKRLTLPGRAVRKGRKALRLRRS